jgi:predicted nucleic acid-binding protein
VVELIIDASVALKWQLDEPLSDKARALLEPQYALLAPDFVLSEIANALWKSCRAGRVDAAFMRTAMEGAPRFFRSLLETPPLLQDAVQLAIELDHPVYDCIYVIAGQRLNAPLITADTKLVAKLAGTPHAAHVVLLSAWQAQ